MGVSTITRRRFQCDRCRIDVSFENDCEAGKGGWALLDVNGKEYALCPDHYLDLRTFLSVNSIKPNSFTSPAPDGR